MNWKTIEKIQKDSGAWEMQKLINSGTVWHLEGFLGRQANDWLGAGVCMLPKRRFEDHYGNTVPSRDDVEPGTKGSYLNCKRYWKRIKTL